MSEAVLAFESVSFDYGAKELFSGFSLAFPEGGPHLVLFFFAGVSGSAYCQVALFQFLLDLFLLEARQINVYFVVVIKFAYICLHQV